MNKIFKPKRFDVFTAIPTDILRTKGISLSAVGLYCWLLSHDDGMEITITFCANLFKDGKDSIRTRLKELETFGFVRMEPVRKDGKFSGYNYHILTPCGIDRSGSTVAENPTQSNTTYNIHKKESNSLKLFSPEIEKAFPHFVALFPTRNQPSTKKQIESWKDCLDKIQRIDKYNLRDVYTVCKMVREDDFWSKNFLSILKLRNADKNGVKYIERFMSQTFVKSRPNAFSKVKGLIEFIKYDHNERKIGAKTKSGNLYDYNLKQILTADEYVELQTYIYENE